MAVSSTVPGPATKPGGKPDWLLLGIVAGVVLLVAIGLGTALLTERTEEYVGGDAPGDVVHNYFVALDRGDTTRAYGYLAASVKLNVSYERFVQAVGGRSSASGPRPRLRVDSAKVEGDTATVSVTVLRATRSGPFGLFGASEYAWSRPVVLRREDGAWRIVVEPSEPYQLRFWY